MNQIILYMFEIIITPGVQNTDGLGHINNGVLSEWFETARTPIYKIFTPTLEFSHDKWRLIMVHSEYDYYNQIYFKRDVVVRTFIKKIGKTSFTVYHELFQENKKCASGSVVLVHYDFEMEENIDIPDDIRKKLKKHFYRYKTTKSNYENYL